MSTFANELCTVRWLQAMQHGNSHITTTILFLILLLFTNLKKLKRMKLSKLFVGLGGSQPRRRRKAASWRAFPCQNKTSVL